MKKVKCSKQYKPEVSMEQILAFDKDNPETYTRSELVNAVCELLADKEVLADGHVADRLGIDSKHLAFALEVLTGHNTSAIRAELVAHRWRTYQKGHPHCGENAVAHAIGFADSTALFHFMERNKTRFPELYIKEQEANNLMAPIVENLMPQESADVRRVFIRLPYHGSPQEKEACLRILYSHGRHVADLALDIARRKPDLFPHLEIVECCALLHNIGIVHTNMPELHCHGKKEYIRHGEAGCEMLSRLRFNVASLVAGSHLGSGITYAEQIEKGLNVSAREPNEPIEKLICYASCFYSIFKPLHKKSLKEIRTTLSQYGEPAVKRFDELHAMFG